jgi:hypothetical protein
MRDDYKHAYLESKSHPLAVTPLAKRIVTPSYVPIAETVEEYQTFLRSAMSQLQKKHLENCSSSSCFV